ncbi:MAG TPA: hypothetical protein PLS66_04610 [Tepiditoga sp.]|nr:hypothetical protein [Tepiditoga sp.]
MKLSISDEYFKSVPEKKIINPLFRKISDNIETYNRSNTIKTAIYITDTENIYYKNSAIIISEPQKDENFISYEITLLDSLNETAEFNYPDILKTGILEYAGIIKNKKNFYIIFRILIKGNYEKITEFKSEKINIKTIQDLIEKKDRL